MANDDPKVTFRVFNQEFNKGISEMNTEGKKLRQELKLQQEQLKLTGSESDKLGTNLESLQRQYALAQQKTQSTAEQLVAVKRQFGENSEETARMETALRRAQIAEQQLANRISQTSAQLDKAKAAESEATNESDRRRQALNELKTAETQLESSSKRLSSEYDLQKAKLGANASEAEKMAAAQNHVQQQATITKQAIANLEQQLSLTEQEYGKNSTEANQMAARLNAAKSSIANMDNELEKIKSSGSDAAESMDSLGKKLSAGLFMGASEKLTAIGDKLIEVGKSAIEGASEISDSQVDIQANFNMTAGEAEKVQDVVNRVFERGVTESMDSASKAVQDVKSYMGDLNNADLEKVTNKVIGIGKHTDTDVNENVRAASQLMNHFGVSSDQSLDLIAAGFQNGLNKSDDFLDTLNEYSPQFAQAGFSAKDMLNVISQGMSSGAFNTDKAADAVKEFGIRLKDGTIKKSIKSYSSDTQDLFKKYQDGKATASEVFQSINKDVANTTNHQKKYMLGNTAMGTQFEDLGDKAVTAFSKTGHAMDDVSGKADAFNKRSPGEKWNQSLRELQDEMKTIGSDLIQDLQPVIEMVSELAAWFGKLPGPVRLAIEIIGGLIAALTLLAPVIAALIIIFSAFSVVNGVLTVSIGALSFAFWPVVLGILAIIAAVVAVIAIIRNWGAITTWLRGIWSAFTGWLSGLWQGIVAVAQIVWGSIAGFFTGLWQGISSVATSVWNGISGFFTGLWNGIVATARSIWGGIVTVFQFIWALVASIFQSAWTLISSLLIAAWNILVALTRPIWQPIATFFSSLWNGIKNVAMSVWNAISSFLMSVWNGIKAFATPVFSAISSVISSIWNGIRSVTSSIWNGIKGVITSVWNGIKSGVSAAVNVVHSIVSSVWNGIRSVTSSVWNGIHGTISSVWGGIKSAVSGAVGVVRSIVSGAWNGIHSVTSSVWNGIKSAITGPMNAAKSAVGKIINGIKGFFTGLHLSLPHIDMPPLPHFKFSGKFSLKPPSVPHLSVDWYANGGIFDQASVIGIGEAGKEAALPLVGNAMNPFADAVANRMLSNLPQMAQKQLASQVTNNNNITINATVRGNDDIKKIAEEVSDVINWKADRKAAAVGGTAYAT
jgi:TP901 family phage tail tape measure protein